MKYISFFHVDRLYSDLSDHCQISLMLKVNCIGLQNDSVINMKPLPVKYKLDNSSAQLFTETLTSHHFKEKLHNIEQAISRDDNDLVQDFNSIIIEICEITLRKSDI